MHISLMRSHRHTVMDGRVVTFATNFVPVYRPVGPFEVSASRNRVTVHRAELVTQSDFAHMERALEYAQKEMEYLAKCDGRPDDDESGEPREVVIRW